MRAFSLFGWVTSALLWLLSNSQNKYIFIYLYLSREACPS